MKIGIFDSGLGGLIIAKAIHKAMPEYDYVYLGDTKRVPYGNRSHETVYQFTKEAVDYLFQKENCALVILACNTASARALRRIQADYKNTSKKVLGVLIPTAEECVDLKKVGVLATRGTVSSETFVKEIKKINKNCVVFQNPAPMLVPFAEEGEHKLAVPFILKYLKPLMEKNAEAIILGCTHYPIFKKEFKKILPKNIKLISQDEIIPKKLKDYLKRHQEISKKLSHKKTIKILVTDKTQNVEKLSGEWFGKNTKPKLINL
ncbi:MAG: glutamate racemase [Candidatus Pacebacteria bacterium]|nr:glutamate racemase [Candidatus Paceibacterota bacterium]